MLQRAIVDRIVHLIGTAIAITILVTVAVMWITREPDPIYWCTYTSDCSTNKSRQRCCRDLDGSLNPSAAYASLSFTCRVSCR